MSTLTKAVLAESLQNKLGFTIRDSKSFVDDFFSTLSNEIVEGELKLSGFGNFVTREKPSRPGRNPKTKEPVTITARRVCTFKAGLKLRNRCEQPKKKS
ncbi:Integration host factor subunit alpha [Vibrio coralliirubri]|uniref:HU family DNA-binding protein n=1 Tax=Vibrio coralliirubri TaxID=1516159 RepID=UPI000638CA5C|nr:HU family DNA-binding protein [Vibrio coralliirubri]CDT53404.1 Integration host factor subunit alpha [Vibrio coralliirubri]